MLVGTVAAALVLAASAQAHVTITPPFVDAGLRTRIVFETPNERPPHATTSLVIDGAARRRRSPPPRRLPAGASWSRAGALVGRAGGSRAGRSSSFPLFVTARTRAGTEAFRAVQGYDDGEVVRWDANLTVLPAAGSEAPSQHIDRALAAGAVGLVVILASFLGAAAPPPEATSRAIAAAVATVVRAVLFSQVLNDDLGCASYLVGCEEAQEAVVVDPPVRDRDGPRRGRPARRTNRPRRSRRTLTRTTSPVTAAWRSSMGFPVSIHPAAAVEYPNDPLDDGDEVTVGSVRVRCIHTPGHRPEHCCLAVIDTTRADEPWLVLTGDSLFVGDTARPDLAVGAMEGAEGLFHSSAGFSSCPTASRCSPVTSRARCAARR